MSMQKDVSTQADMLLAVLLPKWLIPVPDTEDNTRFVMRNYVCLMMLHYNLTVDYTVVTYVYRI